MTKSLDGASHCPVVGPSSWRGAVIGRSSCVRNRRAHCRPLGEEMGIQRPKVLLIDDDPDFLKLLTMLLRRDYFVLTASTGGDGVEKS